MKINKKIPMNKLLKVINRKKLLSKKYTKKLMSFNELIIKKVTH